MRDGEGSGPTVPAAGRTRWAAASPAGAQPSTTPPHQYGASDQTHRLQRCEPRAEKLELSAPPRHPSPSSGQLGSSSPAPQGPFLKSGALDLIGLISHLSGCQVPGAGRGCCGGDCRIQHLSQAEAAGHAPSAPAGISGPRDSPSPSCHLGSGVNSPWKGLTPSTPATSC